MLFSKLFTTIVFSTCLLFVTVNAHQNRQYNQQPPQQQAANGHQDSFLDHADREHIAHDVKDQYYVDIEGNIPESEMDFYNFKLHDLDNNFLLDGIELLAAMNHDNHDKKPVDEQSRGTLHSQEAGQKKIDSDALLIDHILEEYDQDKDGHISFAEFKRVRASIHN